MKISLHRSTLASDGGGEAGVELPIILLAFTDRHSPLTYNLFGTVRSSFDVSPLVYSAEGVLNYPLYETVTEPHHSTLVL